MFRKLILIKTFFLILCFSIKAQITFINPTGTYSYGNQKPSEDGEIYGYFGEVKVIMIDSLKIAIDFYVCKGALSYNSGSFVDTLDYKNNTALYRTESDSTCLIIFEFDKLNVNVEEKTADYNFGCGFGHGVVASGQFKKESDKTPKIGEVSSDD
jgi:hypothetical protein